MPIFQCIAMAYFGKYSFKLFYYRLNCMDTIKRLLPWAYTKTLPSDYPDLFNVSVSGANALKSVYVIKAFLAFINILSI